MADRRVLPVQAQAACQRIPFVRHMRRRQLKDDLPFAPISLPTFRPAWLRHRS
jgi:hypothetical protein